MNHHSGEGIDLNTQLIESLICAVLRGETPAWPDADDAALVEAFLECSDYHGVQGLLYERLRTLSGWPPTLVQALHRDAIDATAAEMVRQRVVAEMLGALAAVGIEAVLIKGTALAYSLYAVPRLRTRADTDLLVPMHERRRALDVLTKLGFARVLELGELTSYQACLTREGVGGHTIDLHWQISNSELLARLFSYEELRAGAELLPSLAPQALGISPVHALLIAAMHRAVHEQAPYFFDGQAHHSGDRLIWLYDIHLLAMALTPAQWDGFLTLAARKGLRAVCLEGIDHARRCYGTPIPEQVLAALADPGPLEPAAAYLRARHLRRRWLDLLAYDGWLRKFRFARDLAFPPALYMRERFPHARPDWLPWLYLRRALGGLRRR
jgi:hypothetical protein